MSTQIPVDSRLAAALTGCDATAEGIEVCYQLQCAMKRHQDMVSLTDQQVDFCKAWLGRSKEICAQLVAECGLSHTIASAKANYSRAATFDMTAWLGNCVTELLVIEDLLSTLDAPASQMAHAA